MTIFTEGRHAAEFVIFEGAMSYSRDALRIAESQDVQPGRVLGRRAIVAEVDATPSAAAGNTGDATIAMGAPAVTSKVKAGRYKGIAVTATTVRWEDPDGKEIGVSTHGSAFAKGGIKFTITAGGSANVAGDEFYVDVAADVTDFEYGAHDPASTDGFEVACAIALYPAATGSGENATIAGIVRHARVNGKLLTWKEGATAAEIADGRQALEAAGIIVA